jgi:formate dehydrogenase major subunit
VNAPIPLIEFELDGRTLTASPGETLLQVARREGIAIPHLCYKDGFAQVGNCRA